MSQSAVLLLIDAMNIIARNHGAIARDESLPHEEVVSRTTNSSLGTMNRALTMVNPTHVAVVFEGEGNWRYNIYPDYKSHRPEKKSTLIEASALIREKLETAAMLRTLHSDGFEADDVIASMALRARKGGVRVVAVATDKDYWQLLAHGVEVLDIFENAYRDREFVLRHEKMGVEPCQVADSLALQGDGTDGIPGVPKVGAKTAAKWLREYGSIEGVLANANHIKGKVGQHLRDNIETARTCYRMVVLEERDDLQLNVSLSDLRVV